MANTKSPLNHSHAACAACGSLDTQVGFDEITCLKCGRLTSLVSGDLVSEEAQFSPCGL